MLGTYSVLTAVQILPHLNRWHEARLFGEHPGRFCSPLGPCKRQFANKKRDSKFLFLFKGKDRQLGIYLGPVGTFFMVHDAFWLRDEIHQIKSGAWVLLTPPTPLIWWIFSQESLSQASVQISYKISYCTGSGNRICANVTKILSVD